MLINTQEPTCPTCGGTLMPTSHADLTIDEINGIIVMMVGTCDCCGNRYQWNEHYAYKGYSDVEKISKST